VTNYEKGRVVDHEGSFEAGVDGAQAGLALPADPKPGMSYRQDFVGGGPPASSAPVGSVASAKSSIRDEENRQ